MKKILSNVVYFTIAGTVVFATLAKMLAKINVESLGITAIVILALAFKYKDIKKSLLEEENKGGK